MTSKPANLVSYVILCLGAPLVFIGCAGPKRVPPIEADRAFTEATIAARAAFQQNRLDQAAALYEIALRRARALDESSMIGEAAYNLAACRLRLQQHERARPLLTEAGHALARSGPALADVLILQARAAHLAGDDSEARAFIQQLRGDPSAQPTPAQLCQVAIIEGQTACKNQDWVLATDLLRQAREVLGPGAGSLLKAQLAGLAATIALGTRDFRTAAASLDQRAALLREAKQYWALGAALAQAGEAYRELEEYGLAADHLYRAARCAAGWGETASTKRWAQAALAIARQADDALLSELIQGLLLEFAEDNAVED